MKRPKGWMALTDTDKFNTVLKCFELYKGDLKKTAEHIFLTLGGTTANQIRRDVIYLMPHVLAKVKRDSIPQFDYNRHVSLPSVGSKKYVFDKQIHELVDLEQKKPDR